MAKSSEPAYKINQPNVVDMTGGDSVGITMQSFRKIDTEEASADSISYVEGAANNSFESYANSLIDKAKSAAQSFLNEAL